jgi:hypothetical protein
MESDISTVIDANIDEDIDDNISGTMLSFNSEDKIYSVLGETCITHENEFLEGGFMDSDVGDVICRYFFEKTKSLRLANNFKVSFLFNINS